MTQSSIIPLFPTLIHVARLSQFSEFNRKVETKSIELKNTVKADDVWNCNTYSTVNKYDITKDPMASSFVSACKSEVIKFSKLFGVETEIFERVNGWVNVSEKGNFQEYHNHDSSHFSCAYYVKAPKNCGSIRFKSHEAFSNMFPLPVVTATDASYSTYHIVPEECNLVIFRSNLQHMVDTNMSTENRISISMNFTFKGKL